MNEGTTDERRMHEGTTEERRMNEGTADEGRTKGMRKERTVVEAPMLIVENGRRRTGDMRGCE